MGFLGEFAYGFSQAAKPILEAQAKANADADARIRERVASVEPDAQLYQRQKDIDAATQLKERQQRMDMQMGQLHNASPELQADANATGISIPESNQGTPMPNAPTPTITQGSAPNMAPSATTAPQPFTQAPTAAPIPAAPAPVDHMSLYNEYKVLQQKAFQAGDKESAESWGIAADRHKAMQEHEDKVGKIEPTPNKSAEGINVNEQLVKDADANDKANGTSFYAPEFASVFAQPDSTMNWKGDKYYAENVHTPLAQAEMAHQRKLTPDKPETEVFGIVKQNTLTPTSDIATLEMNNPHITVSQKQQAMQDLMSYMKSTYGNDIDAAIAQDKNLQHVFNTKLLNTMTTIANQAKPQPTPME